MQRSQGKKKKILTQSDQSKKEGRNNENTKHFFLNTKDICYSSNHNFNIIFITSPIYIQSHIRHIKKKKNVTSALVSTLSYFQFCLSITSDFSLEAPYPYNSESPMSFFPLWSQVVYMHVSFMYSVFFSYESDNFTILLSVLCGDDPTFPTKPQSNNLKQKCLPSVN